MASDDRQSVSSSARPSIARPSIASAAKSPTALSNLVASFLLMAGLFLPHSVSCNDETIYPRMHVQEAIEGVGSNPSALVSLIFVWPYLFGGLTFCLFAIFVVLRPRWFAKALFVPSGVGFLVLAIAWVLLLFGGRQESREALWIAVIVLPSAAYVAMRILAFCRDRRWVAAATWAHGLVCVWSVFSLRWFWFPPISYLRWGGVLSIIAAVLMMLASWTWTVRGEYDLVDRCREQTPYQISLRQIIFAVTLTAIGLAYWRAIGSS
jgi:hypothetical protein